MQKYNTLTPTPLASPLLTLKAPLSACRLLCLVLPVRLCLYLSLSLSHFLCLFSSHRDVAPFRHDGGGGRVSLAPGSAESPRHPIEKQERLAGRKQTTRQGKTTTRFLKNVHEK